MLMDGPSSPVQASSGRRYGQLLRGEPEPSKTSGWKHGPFREMEHILPKRAGFFQLQKDLGMEYVSYPESKVYWINFLW